jgi:hypothetical protein
VWIAQKCDIFAREYSCCDKRAVTPVDRLPLPFASWQEGLLALVDGLSDPEREKIIVARLELTAAKRPIGWKEICALALLVRSHARFDRETLPKHEYEPDPTFVALGQKETRTKSRT